MTYRIRGIGYNKAQNFADSSISDGTQGAIAAADFYNSVGQTNHAESYQ
jgi:hypothetical protein